MWQPARYGLNISGNENMISPSIRVPGALARYKTSSPRLASTPPQVARDEVVSMVARTSRRGEVDGFVCVTVILPFFVNKKVL